jgi:hypothetical protein
MLEKRLKVPIQSKRCWKLRRKVQFKQIDAVNCAESFNSNKTMLETALKASIQTK